MGIETIPDRKAGQTPQKSWINNFRDVLSGDFIGRYLTGAVRANAGRLGNSNFKFKRHFVFSGDFGPGDVLPWYDYAGLYDIPQGWMLCNGVIINEANYDTQHATGDWDTFVGTSALDGLYLPNMNDNFPIGSTAALQAGTVAITTTGAHTANLAHTHGTFNTGNVSATLANRQYNVHDKTYSSSHTHSVTLASALSAAQNIEPEHLLAKFLMRVI